jgi:hypothetical protein
MGFKQREKARKKKAAMVSSQAVSRTKAGSRAPSSAADKWWLTVVRTTTCCARCGGVLRPGGEMVYRHTPREARCVLCGEELSALFDAYVTRQIGGATVPSPVPHPESVAS